MYPCEHVLLYPPSHRPAPARWCNSRFPHCGCAQEFHRPGSRSRHNSRFPRCADARFPCRSGRSASHSSYRHAYVPVLPPHSRRPAPFPYRNRHAGVLRCRNRSQQTGFRLSYAATMRRPRPRSGTGRPVWFPFSAVCSGPASAGSNNSLLCSSCPSPLMKPRISR